GTKEVQRQVFDPLSGALLDVVPVQPVQLLHVEDGGRWRDSLEREFLDQLLDREDFASASRRRPAQQRQVIHKRFRQNSHVAEICNRGCTMALRETLAVRTKNR